MKRTKTKWIVVLALSLSLVLADAVFFISWTNPLVLYYGVKMRNSELTSLAQSDPTLSGVYCLQLASFSLDATFICFDSKNEVDEYMMRRDPVQARFH